MTQTDHMAALAASQIAENVQNTRTVFEALDGIDENALDALQLLIGSYLQEKAREAA